MNVQKILLLNALIGHGKGGHSWSFKTVCEELHKKYEIDIVYLAISKSPAEPECAPVTYIKYRPLNILRTTFDLYRKVKSSKPDIIHTFDIRVDFIVNLVSLLCRVPIVKTKCGGAPNVHKISTPDALIVFTSLEKNLFSENKCFSNCPINVIPNRVKRFQSDESLIRDFNKIICRQSEELVILRISRITSAYRTVLLQSVALHKLYLENSIKSRLVILGTIDHQNIFEELNSLVVENFSIITDERFTRNAKLIIDAADIVIGTGRSTIEAASLSRIIFSPIKDSPLPILLRKENYEIFSNHNFSPRSALDNLNLPLERELALRCANDISYRKELSSFSSNIFTQFYDSTAVPVLYDALYKNLDSSYKFCRHLKFFSAFFLQDLKKLFGNYKTCRRIFRKRR